MKLLEFKRQISELTELNFIQQNGIKIPTHFHITEVGQITKHFIDCGGTERIEKVVNFQLWFSNDVKHRLTPEKLITILSLSESKLGLGNLEIEVEYQTETIGKYGVEFDGINFLLAPKLTDCLAKNNCGVESHKAKLKLSELQTSNEASCAPQSGCRK